MGVLRVSRYDVVAEPGILRPAGDWSDGDGFRRLRSLGRRRRRAPRSPPPARGRCPRRPRSSRTRSSAASAVTRRACAASCRTLRDALPAGTTIALRGSTVAGRSYKTGEPFDAGGPGTSDLDVVVVGEPVVGLWVPEAQLLGGINTLPLSDDARWVAPSLDRARRRAQAVARRPVSIQAMAGWFLDLRTLVQGQPYVVLDGDT